MKLSAMQTIVCRKARTRMFRKNGTWQIFEGLVPAQRVVLKEGVDKCADRLVTESEIYLGIRDP